MLRQDSGRKDFAFEGVGLREGRRPWTLAMHSFGLRGTDDDVGQRRAALEDEHSVFLTGFLLALAHRGWKSWSVQATLSNEV